MTIEQQNQTIAQTLYGALRQRKQRHELLQLGNLILKMKGELA